MVLKSGGEGGRKKTRRAERIETERKAGLKPDDPAIFLISKRGEPELVIFFFFVNEALEGKFSKAWSGGVGIEKNKIKIKTRVGIFREPAVKLANSPENFPAKVIV